MEPATGALSVTFSNSERKKKILMVRMISSELMDRTSEEAKPLGDPAHLNFVNDFFEVHAGEPAICAFQPRVRVRALRPIIRFD